MGILTGVLGKKGGDIPVAERKSLDWEASRCQLLEASESRAWWIARISVLVGILALVGLIVMVPFYKVIPVIYQVDSLTGDAQVVASDVNRIGISDLVSKHWAMRYVQVRERYVWNLLQEDFDTVSRMSDENVGITYKGQYSGSGALQDKLGANVEMLVDVNAVTITGNRAIVRFLRTLKKQGQIEKQRFIATMSFEYKKPGILVRERTAMDNPFGFKVTSYVVDAEVGQ